MGYTTRLNWEPLRSLNTATNPTFGAGGYAALGTPLANQSYILKLVNNSNVLVTISTDGVNDYDVAPANSFWLYDENEGSSNFLPAGTQIYVKSGTGAAGVGIIYLVTQYIIIS